MANELFQPRLEHFLFNGKYNEGIKWIEKEKLRHPQEELLPKYEGDFYKLKGDLEEAIRHWKESNRIRTKKYAKNNYRLAWNYALLSYYHYEKIEPPLAKIYADSCYRLIQNLSVKQQKEIEIHKLWNILAQSYKQQYTFTQATPAMEKTYRRIRGFYKKSLRFIQKHKLPAFYQAKTYHLIGNSYVDNIYPYLNVSTIDPKIYDALAHAMKNYHAADKLWRSTFGLRHHERAKTRYLMGMAHLIFSERYLPHRLSIASSYFDQAMESFGISIDSLNPERLKTIPNKEDVLQCLKFKNESLFLQIHEQGKIGLISDCERVAQQAAALWKIAYNEFKSPNTNQLLAIYNLIPFKDIIEIETTKKHFGRPWSIDRIFAANEKLKYYDLKRRSSSKNAATTSIQTIQRKLTNEEAFLDFLSNQQGQYFCIIIEKNKVHMLALDPRFWSVLQKLKQSINEIDFPSYVTNASELYPLIFGNYPLHTIKKLIICPEGELNTLAFESLLCSQRNANTNDYRKLDYLIRKLKITYVLAPSHFRRPEGQIPLRASAFAPTYTNGNYTHLPFSEKLIAKLAAYSNFICHRGKKATRSTFMAAAEPIVHFSGHGKIDDKTTSYSALIFADSVLSLSEVKRLNSPKLVVLNACNSSNGKILSGDGTQGFVRSFHASGTVVSISNLWEVDDQASNGLFYRFYQTLEHTPSVATALHQTKMKCITHAPNSEMAAPYYWAGHRQVGELSVIPVKQHTSSKRMLIVAGCALLALIGGYVLCRYEAVGGHKKL